MIFQRGRKQAEGSSFTPEFTGFAINSSNNFEISTFNQANMTNWAGICISKKDNSKLEKLLKEKLSNQ